MVLLPHESQIYIQHQKINIHLFGHILTPTGRILFKIETNTSIATMNLNPNLNFMRLVEGRKTAITEADLSAPRWAFMGALWAPTNGPWAWLGPGS